MAKVVCKTFACCLDIRFEDGACPVRSVTILSKGSER